MPAKNQINNITYQSFDETIHEIVSIAATILGFPHSTQKEIQPDATPFSLKKIIIPKVIANDQNDRVVWITILC